MRRQAGADLVDIDTFEGSCRFFYLTPRMIDFDALERAANDASYDLVAITLNLEGEIVRNGDGFELVASETGQRFPIDGQTHFKGRMHLHTTVADWAGEYGHLTVVSGHAVESPR
ncbi:MAG: hypothetical protein ACI9K5_004093 [Gammaproteobacteria bacterium]